MKNNLIGVTGADGRVGRELVRRGCTPLECDVTKPDEVFNSIQDSRVELVIHCAAITDVDYCEKKENEKEVIGVNVRGTYNVVNACQILGIKMIYISTDHVFDGKRWFGSYKETDRPNPINMYGFSKWGGEGICNVTDDNVKIVRTSYLHQYYNEIPYMRDYLKNARLWEIEVPSVIKRTFLSIPKFVNSLLYYSQNFDSMPKLLHVTGTKKLSWHQFVVELAKHMGILPDHFHPRNKYLSEGYVPHPQNGGLDVSLAKSLGLPLYSGLDWDD